MKKNLPQALIICIAAVALALLTNSLRSNGLPLFDAGGSAHSTETNPGVRQIEFEAAVVRFNQGDALFADARSDADFSAGHIAGAVNLPALQPERWLEKFLPKVDPQQTVITYCAGADCTLGKQLAQTLAEAGFEQVFYLMDGWGQWTSRNLPIEKGE